MLAVMMVFGSVAAWAEDPLKTLEVKNEGETVQYKINGGSWKNSDQGIVSVDTIKNEDAISSALSIELNDGTATVNTGDITQTDNKNDDIPPSNTVTIEVIGDDSELNLNTGNIDSDFDGVAVQNGGGTIDITTKISRQIE